MAAPKSWTLEFTIQSAEDLRIDGRPVKKNAFALVKTTDDQLIKSKSTAADLDGGSYPRWNERVVIELPVRALSVTLEVQCRVGSGNRVVGSVAVPASDFLGNRLTPENCLHFLSYRLRDPRGVKNGIINFSVKVTGGDCGGGGGGGDYYGCSAAAREMESRQYGVGFGYRSSLYSPWRAAPSSWSSSAPWGVPMARDRNGYGGGGVVIGVPVGGGASRLI